MIRNTYTITGSDIMALSESVLASFAPHLQLLLNPQAKILSGAAEEEAVVALRRDETVVGENIPAEISTAQTDVCVAPDALADNEGD
jgi:hypothetical protein